MDARERRQVDAKAIGNSKATTSRSARLLREQAFMDYENGRVAEGMGEEYYEEIERLCEAENE